MHKKCISVWISFVNIALSLRRLLVPLLTQFWCSIAQMTCFATISAFLGSKWYLTTFRGLKSAKPPKGGVNRHFRPKQQILKSQYLSQIRSDHYSTGMENLAHQEWRCGLQNGGKIIPRWSTAAILEVHKHLAIFHQIFCADWHLPCECNYPENYTFFKIQDGGGRHLRFWIFGRMSDALLQIWYADRHWPYKAYCGPKSQFYQKSRWCVDL